MPTLLKSCDTYCSASDTISRQDCQRSKSKTYNGYLALNTQLHPWFIQSISRISKYFTILLPVLLAALVCKFVSSHIVVSLVHIPEFVRVTGLNS